MNLDTLRYKDARKRGLKRQENLMAKFSYGKLEFEYPSFLIKKQYWGPIKRFLAPFVGVTTLWVHHIVLSALFDPTFRSFYISVELEKNMPYDYDSYFSEHNKSLSKKSNYKAEKISDRNAAAYRFSTVIDNNIAVNADFLFIKAKTLLSDDYYWIKCYSLQEDYENNRNIINSIFNSVLIKK